MSIRKELRNAKSDYLKIYDREAELLFINLQTYEDLLNDPNTNLSSDNPYFEGCLQIPANTLNEPYLFLEKRDLEKAIEAYDREPDYFKAIQKFRKVESREATYARRVTPDFKLETIHISKVVIEAYKRYLEK